MAAIMSAQTKGPWVCAGRWDSINSSIQTTNPKNGLVIALAQTPGVGGPVSDAQRAANIRLIVAAPDMYGALRTAHKLLIAGLNEKAIAHLASAIDAVSKQRTTDKELSQ